VRRRVVPARLGATATIAACLVGASAHLAAMGDAHVTRPWARVLAPPLRPLPRYRQDLPVLPDPRARRDRAPSLASVGRRYGVSALTLRRVLRWAPLARRYWRHGPLALPLAVVAVESSGRPDAVSGEGAEGLMQVMPVNFAAWGLSARSALEPAPSMRAGTGILRADLREYGISAGLEAYNAGPGGIGVDWSYPAQVLRWAAALRAVLAERRG
jgi:soluble lytic murein transglycosylase-like protein